MHAESMACGMDYSAQFPYTVEFVYNESQGLCCEFHYKPRSLHQKSEFTQIISLCFSGFFTCASVIAVHHIDIFACCTSSLYFDVTLSIFCRICLIENYRID